ncbi:MAG: ATPase domain-containing protein, partial [Candidatus Firestonebacteria bacterium]
TRKIMLAFLSELKTYKTTALLTSELPEKGETLSADGISEFISDGVILLKYIIIGTIANRSMEIKKMRYTKITGKIKNYEFGKAGIFMKKEGNDEWSDK